MAVKKQATPQEKGHMERVATLPCSVSNKDCKGRTTVQHLQGYAWRAGYRRGSHFHTIPLCEGHHLHGKHSIEEGIGSKGFVKLHGEEGFHLEKTRHLLSFQHPDYCVFTGIRICPETSQTAAIIEAGQLPRSCKPITKGLHIPVMQWLFDDDELGNGWLFPQVGQSEKIA